MTCVPFAVMPEVEQGDRDDHAPAETDPATEETAEAPAETAAAAEETD